MELTDKENAVLEVVREYCSEFDMETKELLGIIKKELKMERKTAEGVIGSLAKKNVIKMMEINGEPSVWFPEE